MPFVTLLFFGIRRQIVCGLDTCKPTSPNVGDLYVATGTNKLYVCFVPGIWSAPFILSVPTSGEYKITGIKFAKNGKFMIEYDNIPTP